jgi:hypothetical protein
MLIVLILAALPEFAAGYELQVAYSDVTSGPLMTSTDGGVPLPDGCLGQIIVHVADGPIPPPDAAGIPGGGDSLLIIRKLNDQPNCPAQFQVNGAERLGAAGYFAVSPGMAGNAVPTRPVYMRIWNAASPDQASLYYDSPPYTVGEGRQQMNFGREQLLSHDQISPDPRAPSGGQQLSRTRLSPLDYQSLVSYPNPFNGETTLTFALPNEAQARVDVYDVQGRIVRSMANGTLAAGEHRLLFSAPELTSGTYFAVLRANGEPIAIRRMLLVR